jgi:4-amino-4-deoxy-L-arabinose transferase-like glycosyltransferase
MMVFSVRRVFVGCILAATVASLCFGLNLDRYPLYYADEPYFSYPALRYLEGKGLTYQVSAYQPRGKSLYAMHGPFFPWLQVLTFRILGTSQFSCRLPNFLGAYLAVMVLCLSLIRRGAWWTAAVLALALAWVGDRSSQEVLIGRMDGLALLFLATGLLGLVRVLDRQSPRWAAVCGCLLGTAVGFHPMCVQFVMVAMLLLAYRASGVSRWKLPLAFAAGGLIPAALFVWCWSPDLVGSIEQFRWASRFQAASRSRDDIAKFLRVLRWSRYWWAGLVATVMLFFLPIVVGGLITGRPLKLSRDTASLWVGSAGFSLAGLSVLLSSAKHPYYLVYFTVWPVIGLGVLVESMAKEDKRVRNAALGLGALLFLCWLPSLLWNSLRFREMMLYRGNLDQNKLAHEAKSVNHHPGTAPGFAGIT